MVTSKKLITLHVSLESKGRKISENKIISKSKDSACCEFFSIVRESES